MHPSCLMRSFLLPKSTSRRRRGTKPMTVPFKHSLASSGWCTPAKGLVPALYCHEPRRGHTFCLQPHAKHRNDIQSLSPTCTPDLIQYAFWCYILSCVCMPDEYGICLHTGLVYIYIYMFTVMSVVRSQYMFLVFIQVHVYAHLPCHILVTADL